MEIKAPYLPYDVLRQRAEQFLSQHHSSREIPIPIEEIIEFQFEIDIVPEPGLHEHFDVDSYITRDLTEIRVDEFVYQSRPGRYRFSLAHELGHRVLHQDVFSCLTFSTINEWRQAISNVIPEKQYGYLEFQASSFAGLILVPSTELELEYDKVCKVLEAHGLSMDEDSEVARDLVSQHIAESFGVSSAVVKRRLQYDRLWDSTVE